MKRPVAKALTPDAAQQGVEGISKMMAFAYSDRAPSPRGASSTAPPPGHSPSRAPPAQARQGRVRPGTPSSARGGDGPAPSIFRAARASASGTGTSQQRLTVSTRSLRSSSSGDLYRPGAPSTSTHASASSRPHADAQTQSVGGSTGSSLREERRGLAMRHPPGHREAECSSCPPPRSGRGAADVRAQSGDRGRGAQAGSTLRPTVPGDRGRRPQSHDRQRHEQLGHVFSGSRLPSQLSQPQTHSHGSISRSSAPSSGTPRGAKRSPIKSRDGRHSGHTSPALQARTFLTKETCSSGRSPRNTSLEVPSGSSRDGSAESTNVLIWPGASLDRTEGRSASLSHLGAKVEDFPASPPTSWRSPRGAKAEDSPLLRARRL